MDQKLQKSIVSPKIKGQLGNHLFIISTTLAYAWDYDATAIFPDLHSNYNRASYNKDRLFFRLDTCNSPRPFKHVYHQKLWYDTDPIPFQEDLILDGYFQSYVRFHKYRDKLLSVFAPSEFTLKCLNEKYKDLLENPKTVGVHVRTSGRSHHILNKHKFLGFDYYEKAFNMFPDDSLFVVCADRINWCKKYFPQRFNKNFVFIEGNYGIEDLFLLANCRHDIIANSTFSWWAAYFNQHPGRRVIAPDEWDSCPPHPNPKEGFYLPEWETISFKVEPYPDDMYDYDETQSADGNE